MTEEYLFGDTDLAARRLAVLADVFSPTSRALLVEAVDFRPRLAADLGCGPGHTTHLLGQALQCERAAGLDNSEHFIALAKKTATANVSFHLHDVRQLPFPVGPCNVIYARFLLTHQTRPETLLARWAGQLEPHGRLLIEELDAIRTQLAEFGEYVAIVEAMLAHAGRRLYLGPLLHAMQTPGNLARVSSRTARVQPTNDLAAKMFWMNIQTWKRSRFVRGNISPDRIARLEARLRALAETPTQSTDIEWQLRQLVFGRAS